jgi:broad specificity phosphatase PhoE
MGCRAGPTGRPVGEWSDRLSSLYLIRHGQAGTRGRYDALSDLGRRQAYLLGQYLAAQQVPFKALIAGCLNRQRQTADEVWRAYREAGVVVPGIVSDPNWNEFDMTAVFSEFAPLLSEADPRFKHDYDELLRKLEDAESPIHQAWTDCDTQAMRAWMEGRYPCRTESWAAFGRRVLSARRSLGAYQPGDAVAIFTSATPISIWIAAALGVSDSHIMRLAGAMYNSAVTTMRLRDDDLMLFSFNGVPHLNEPQLRTFR